MTKSSSTLKGVIPGKTIELEREPELPDGQEVSVTLEAMLAPAVTSPAETDVQHRFTEALTLVQDLNSGEGLRQSFGAWADDVEELDEYLESSRKRRKLGRQGMEP